MNYEFKGNRGNWHIHSKLATKGQYAASELDINFNEGLEHCVTIWCDEETPTQEEQANAQLISCAPEMFEMLNSVLNDNYDHSDKMNQIEQLLKKATTI